MSRRGLTGVVWLLGLAAVTYEDVVAPIAHAAFGDRVTHERVHAPAPEACDDWAAVVARGLEGWL